MEDLPILVDQLYQEMMILNSFYMAFQYTTYQ